MGAVFSAFDDLYCERQPAYAVTFDEEKTNISTREGYREFVIRQLKCPDDYKSDPLVGQRIADKQTDDANNVDNESDDIYFNKLDIV